MWRWEVWMIMNSNSVEKKLTKKDLKQVFVRSIAYNSSFNYERQLNLGWAFSLMPVLRKLYKDDEEQMKAALARHLEFNNITPFICTVLFGITAAMEEQNANDRDFDTESINAVKVGLMGPLSAIGDSIFLGTLRVIAASLGCSLALKGNILGPIIYLLIFNIPNFASRYFLMYKGYELGTSFLDKVEESGIMDKIFKGAGILGLMVIGGMVATNVSVPLTVAYDDVKILDTINGVMPNLLPLCFTGLIFYFLKKDIKVTYIHPVWYPWCRHFDVLGGCMKIGLINEDSQADKNAMIFDILKQEAEKKGHTVFNYGMYTEQDSHQINFTQIGILAAVLLHSHAVDFVVTGCGTGQGAMISCNAFADVVCGYVNTPLDAYLFTQVNAGNAVSLPFSQYFGWGAEINLKYVFEKLFAQEFGGGYPQCYAEGEKRSRARMMNETKLPAQYALLEALQRTDQELLKQLLDYPQFQEQFFRNAEDTPVTRFIKNLLHP